MIDACIADTATPPELLFSAAYTSFFFGRAAEYIVPALVAPRVSRGHESLAGLMFMRASVVLCDLLVLIPAAYLFMQKLLFVTPSDETSAASPASSVSPAAARRVLILLPSSPHRSLRAQAPLLLLAAVLCPALLLVDHGHFQVLPSCDSSCALLLSINGVSAG
jgi:hypothetical protein